MRPSSNESLRIIRDYHERTKHRLDRMAASPGFMDWPSQPDPYRSFAGAERISLAHPELRAEPTFDELQGNPPPAAELDAAFLGRFFYHCLALSAWKKVPGAPPWSLRINPSSGALHPTEGYLVCGPVPDLSEEPGIYHYAPFHHAIERRATLASGQWKALAAGFPQPCAFVGLTSIFWRESWKYGERAFRYCNHDVGHAIGAVAYAARLLGWEAKLVEGLAPADLDRLLGIHVQEGPEAEHADCLVALYPDREGGTLLPGLSLEAWQERIPTLTFAGEPNTLSPSHREWPVIDEAARAVRVPFEPLESFPPTPVSAPLPDRSPAAETIIRRRRSAVAMDGETSMDAADFFRILRRTLPGAFPFDVQPGRPRISLVFFVHRVEGLAPGLYLLIRSPSHEEPLRGTLRGEFAWERPDACPEGLNLLLLERGDGRPAAKMLSCRQDIASDGAFSLGMLAQFDAAIEEGGPAAYPRLFWESGLIGQVLYLEAEAAGMRGCGIGCYFDDEVHRILEIEGTAWQSLYHFTVGGPMEDGRLQTLPPYSHLENPLRVI